ncbi:MAG TPA: hypothetical protein PKV31_09620, partial [Saprospiraceae bacterium]|nr:hypothetical protein [Saprospiraceae bacterium]
MGNPPALPEDWKSLTFQGVHQETSSREPPSTRLWRIPMDESESLSRRSRNQTGQGFGHSL